MLPLVRSLVALCSVFFGILCSASPGFAVSSFTGIGDLAGGGVQSFALGVSADGETVVGYSTSASGTEAFRWTEGSGMVGLGDLPGGSFESFAFGVSADGATISGQGRGASGIEAFRWTSATGLQGLGDLTGGNFFSTAHAVSDDGTTVVGWSEVASGNEAFRWTLGSGMVSVSNTPGGSLASTGFGVSADGSTIGGGTEDVSCQGAFIWSSVGGMAGIGSLPATGPCAIARDVSADGSTLVGVSGDSIPGEAFRWTTGAGMAGIGDLPGGSFLSNALGTSADGSIVVGQGQTAAGSAAFIWDSVAGIQDLFAVLTNLGLDLTGWTLLSAQGVSNDGKTIVGYGLSPGGSIEAWRAVIDPPKPIPGDPNRFLTFLSAVAPAHRETAETADAYYAAIDPNDQRLLLSDWLFLNGFGTGFDAEATYVNDADLGFGRHMYVKTHPDGRVASYVENYADAGGLVGDPVDGPTEEKILNVHLADPAFLVATVAMEYGPPPSDPLGTPFTRFLAFGPDGVRVNAADLDHRGAKFLPGACNICHGGNPRPLLADGSYPDKGETGASFLPWDIETFGFSDTLFGGLPLYDLASQQAKFKTLNASVLLTAPTPATRELVEGWYNGAGMPSTDFVKEYVPDGWGGHERAYLEIFAPNCRACHVMRNPAISFQTFSDFTNSLGRAQHLVLDRGVMPLARRTYDRFWASFDASGFAATDLFGPIAVDRQPGSGAPFAFAGADRAAMVGVTETLDATDSSYADTFDWALLSAPIGSLAALDDASLAMPSFTPDLTGLYIFQLAATNANVPGTATDSLRVIATIDGRAGIDFSAQILPIYEARCQSCHSGAVGPDFDGAGPGLGFVAYSEIVYRNFHGRVSVIDPPASLLLQVSTGAITHTGSAALFDPVEQALVSEWITQGARRTIPEPTFHLLLGYGIVVLLGLCRRCAA